MSPSRFVCRTLFMFVMLSVALTPSFSNATSPLVEVHFSPEGKVADHLIELIDQEASSIKAAVYCLMHSEIAKALSRARERGVRVELIVDPYSVKSRSPVGRMNAKGIMIHVWDPEEAVRAHRSLMHDKFCVFGDHTVWTGSFNFTKQASISNRENVVVLRDLAIAKLYLQEFQKIKQAGCRPYLQFLALKAERKEAALK